MAGSQFTNAHDLLVKAIIAMRKAAGLNQRQLADAVGREQNYIARIETRQRRVDFVELVRLCEACGRDPKAELLALLPDIQASSKRTGERRTKR